MTCSVLSKVGIALELFHMWRCWNDRFEMNRSVNMHRSDLLRNKNGFSRKRATNKRLTKIFRAPSESPQCQRDLSRQIILYFANWVVNATRRVRMRIRIVLLVNNKGLADRYVLSCSENHNGVHGTGVYTLVAKPFTSAHNAHRTMKFRVSQDIPLDVYNEIWSIRTGRIDKSHNYSRISSTHLKKMFPESSVQVQMQSMYYTSSSRS